MIRNVLKYNTTQASRRGNPLRFQNITTNFKSMRAIAPLLIVGLFSFVYWFFLTPAFAIENIEIRGTFVWPQNRLASLINDQLAQKRWIFARQNNIFTFDKSTFINAVSKQFAIDKISIGRHYPHTMIITTLEKPRKALWSSKGTTYALDAEGVITGVADLNTNKNPFIIYNKDSEETEKIDNNMGALSAGAPALSAKTMNFLNDLVTTDFIKSLNPRFAIVDGFNPSYAIIKFFEQEKPATGWSVYFNIDDAVQKQVESLRLVLQHSITPDKRSALNYIDLRFNNLDNKVYYQ